MKRWTWCAAITALLCGAGWAGWAQQPASIAAGQRPSNWTPFAGDHEIGIASGYSPHGGPIWGYDQNVHYSPTTLRYSLLIGHYPRLDLRYAPEMTVLSVMHETAPSQTNPAAPITHYGAGLSPVAFRADFRPNRRVQPYFAMAGGFIYYADRVLSPQGSQYMYTVDFGPGVNLYTSRRNAVSLGFKYQHLSNANISIHNPGTDAQTFYVGFAHFWTKGVH